MPRDGGEIVKAKASRRRADRSPIPIYRMPSAPIAGHLLIDTQSDYASSGEGSALSAIVSQIVELQKIRRFCIKSQSRCDRSIESLIASALGYRPDADEKGRKAVFQRAAEIRKSVERGRGHSAFDPHDEGALSSILHLIPLSAASRKLWDDRRKEVEKDMEKLAVDLPVAEFAKAIRGFSLFNLAVLVGEAGRPLSDYRSVSALWKRLGLAVIDGQRQRRVTGKMAEAHGYSPTRRAEVYVVGSVALFMAQKPGMKYRDVYDRRRRHTEPRIEATADLPVGDPARWTKGRCDNDARRVMTKSLVADLWQAWREASVPLIPI